MAMRRPEDPRIWGRVTWQSMHCFANAYPEQPSDADKQAYRAWFLSLQGVLPCRYCREHFPANLRQAGYLTEEALSSRDKFKEFMSRFHDCVTNSISKKAPKRSATRKATRARRVTRRRR